IPSLRRVNVSANGAAVLAGVLQAPLLRERRIVGGAQGVQDVVWLGIQNAWVVLVATQGGLQRRPGGKFDQLQPFDTLEFPFDGPACPGMGRQHGPSAGAGLEPDEDFIGDVLLSVAHIDVAERTVFASVRETSRLAEWE